MLVNNKIKSLWEETPFKSCIYVSLGVSVFLGISILALQNNLPPKLPLFYGRPIGESQLTSIVGFLIAPISALLITLINTMLSFVSKDIFVKKILILSAFMAAMLIAITMVKIIILVGFF